MNFIKTDLKKLKIKHLQYKKKLFVFEHRVLHNILIVILYCLVFLVWSNNCIRDILTKSLKIPIEIKNNPTNFKMLSRFLNYLYAFKIFEFLHF